ncbi:MAG: N-acetylneuraminate synthase family protein [Oscillospiraceae bacterium]|nr:N-acetylneuraminate synthase family protein [Oscillospiraceae bacterium]
MSSLFKDLIIFEMANNHQGDISHGIAIINKLGEVAAKYNINAAVKFQYRDLDTMIHPEFKDRTDVKHIPRFMSTRLSSDQFYQLVCAAKNAGLKTMCTPFDEASVDVIMDHGIEIIKVASCSAIDWPLLEKISETQKPVIISTGGKTFKEMDNIYSFLTHRNVDFAMLHCVGMYPVKEEDVQLNCMLRMKERYHGVTVGYSGHEDPKDYTICKMAVAMGAEILERHVGLETDTIKLNAYSTDVNEVDGWIEAILSARKICGNRNVKNISPAELQSMNELARGCYAAAPIKAGQVINRSDVFFAMPCEAGQTTSGVFQDGMIASKDYAVNEGLVEQRKVTVINDTRSLIHDIRGMLYEAKIVVGNEFELELSHHYGMEHFRHYGAAIINIINREYCKKLIVILPGQQHPNHYHKVKEESFQVLHGTLTLTLDGVTRDVKAGEVVTVERNMEHSFTSVDGCIFEEVSTTHVKNDSYYDDKKIAALDLMQRKTLLESW